MGLLDDLNKSIRKKMVSKTAEDIASTVYGSARETAEKVVAEVRDEENQARAKEAVRNLGSEFRRMGEEALESLGLERDQPQTKGSETESIRERLRREMEDGD